MKKQLLYILVLGGMSLSTSAQDSIYYSTLWKPDYRYFKTGTKQEGIFLYWQRTKKAIDSLLLQTKAYDSLGRLLRQQNFQLNRLRSRFNYYYTGNRLDSMIQEEFWLSETVVHKYFYDSTGNLIQEQTFNDGQETTQTRFVYNKLNQLVQVFTRVGKGKEELTTQYSYRPDQRLQQVDIYFPEDPFHNYSLFYTYADTERTITCSFQRAKSSKRLIDFIRTYSSKGQLLEEILPPFPRRGWLPPGYHARGEEEKRVFQFKENGLLQQMEATVGNNTIWIQKHVYL